MAPDSNNKYATIRAKVLVHSVSPSTLEEANKLGYQSVSMGAVKSSDDDPEDNAFATATPGMSVSMSINNPACFGFFETGKKYYVDFTVAAAS